MMTEDWKVENWNKMVRDWKGEFNHGGKGRLLQNGIYDVRPKRLSMNQCFKNLGKEAE